MQNQLGKFTLKRGGACKPEKGELYDIYDSVKLLEKKKKCKSKPY